MPSPLLHAYAKGMTDIRSGRVKYVKLFDGGLIDNYGLSGITIARAGQTTPYGPLRPEEAINLRRMMFLVVDAGPGPARRLVEDAEGADRQGTGRRGGRRAGRGQFERELYRLSGDDGELAQRDRALALRFEARRGQRACAAMAANGIAAT